MLSINKIGSANIATVPKILSKNIGRKVFPVAGVLPVLAGASMGPVIPPQGVVHTPGSSVTDPLIEQIGYFGHKTIDIGSNMVEGAGDLASSALDGFAHFGGTVADHFSDAADAFTNHLDKIDDTIVDGATKVVSHIIDALG